MAITLSPLLPPPPPPFVPADSSQSELNLFSYTLAERVAGNKLDEKQAIYLLAHLELAKEKADLPVRL